MLFNHKPKNQFNKIITTTKIIYKNIKVKILKLVKNLK